MSSDNPDRAGNPQPSDMTDKELDNFIIDTECNLDIGTALLKKAKKEKARRKKEAKLGPSYDSNGRRLDTSKRTH